MASSLQTLPRTRTARPKGLRPRRPLRRIVGWMLALAVLAGLALLGFVWYVHATTAGAIYTGSDPRLLFACGIALTLIGVGLRLRTADAELY